VSRLITGARLVVSINGRPYAKVVDFSWSSATPAREIYGVDSTEPFELATTVSRGTGAMTIYRMVSDGGAEGAGITVSLPDLPNEKYFSVALTERSSDTVVFQARRCKVTAQEWTVPTRGYVMGTIHFSMMEWSNEAVKATR